MEFFENAIEILELLVKALNGDTETVFTSGGTQNVKVTDISYKVFKPP